MTGRVPLTRQASGEAKSVRLSTPPPPRDADADADDAAKHLARRSTASAAMDAGWLQGAWGMRRRAGLPRLHLAAAPLFAGGWPAVMPLRPVVVLTGTGRR